MKNLIFLSIILIFYSCSSNKTESKTTVESLSTDYQYIGDSISSQVQLVLLSNIAKAIQDSGTAYAVSYCNIHASPLVDSLSNLYGATIQRISLKNRNPDNAAMTELDTEMLYRFTENKNSSLPFKDTLVTSANQTLYYKPITLGMPTCLNCHGVPGKDINEKTLAVLNKKYPNDKAINYKIGDLRGAWKISFEN